MKEIQTFTVNTLRPAEEWMTSDGYEGQLAVDIYQTPRDIVIKAAIAGVEADDLDISVHRDMVMIRGKRKEADPEPGQEYLFQECYWGGFSRSIVLPCEVLSDKARAFLERGILRIRLPKAKRNGARTVRVKDEDEE